MAEGRDEVGAARDWLRAHGVVVPDGAAPSAGGAAPSAEAAADAGAAGAAGDRRRSREGATGERRAGPDEDRAVAELEQHDDRDDLGAAREIGARTGRGSSAPGLAQDEGQGAGGRRTRGRGARRRREHGQGGEGVRGRRDPGQGQDGPGDARPAEDGPDADPEQMARTIVLRKLTAQARTRAELERALRTKAVPEEAASNVLDRMGEVGLVDDAAFARDWVASRQQRRHLSRTALRRELQTKGVDRDVIDEALADVDGGDEHRAALDLARRKASTMGALSHAVAYRRLGGVLARRGFSASVTTQVLAEVLSGQDDD